MVHYLKTKNLHNNEHCFAKIQKNPILGIILKMRFFPKTRLCQIFKIKAL